MLIAQNVQQQKEQQLELFVDRFHASTMVDLLGMFSQSGSDMTELW